MCYFMGQHKVSSASDLFPLEIDEIRFRNELNSGKVKFARIRAQTEEEKQLMKKINRGR